MLRYLILIVVLCINVATKAVDTDGATPETQNGKPAQSRVEQILEGWAATFADVDTSRVTFMRYEYDSVFLLEKRGEGEIHYQAPDRLLWMTKPVELQEEALPRRVSIWGERYQLQSESRSDWYIDRHDIMFVDHEEKTYDRFTMPPQWRHAHPARIDPWAEVSPETAYLHEPGLVSQLSARLLGPILFGVKLGDSMYRGGAMLCGCDLRRFQGEFVWTGNRQTDMWIRLSGKPLSVDGAQCVSRVDVILNTATYRPIAVRMIDPAGTRETVYVIREMAINDSSHRVGPPPLHDYKLLQTTCQLP